MRRLAKKQSAVVLERYAREVDVVLPHRELARGASGRSRISSATCNRLAGSKTCSPTRNAPGRPERRRRVGLAVHRQDGRRPLGAVVAAAPGGDRPQPPRRAALVEVEDQDDRVVGELVVVRR